MCYFIHLYVRPERTPDRARQGSEETAKKHRLFLGGNFPQYAILSGCCSCDLVANEGRSIRAADFVEELAGHRDVKYVRAAWSWGDDKTDDLPEIRLSAAEFQVRNQASKLQSDMAYRVNDPRKYMQWTEPGEPGVKR